MKCSQCGETWTECSHASFEDIARHKMIRVGGMVVVGFAVVLLIVLLIVLPLIGLFT